MPPAFLTEIHRVVLPLGAVVAIGTLLMWLSTRASHRFIQTLPDDVPEKPALLRATSAPWQLLAPLLGLLVGYGILVLFLWPLAAITAAVVLAIAPALLAERLNPAVTDAPLAATEVLLAKAAGREPDPQRWLRRFRAQRQRRERLRVLQIMLYATLLLLIATGGAGSLTIDPVLANRLRVMGMEQELRVALAGQFEGTIITQTPPCVPVNTVYLIPGRDLKGPDARRLVNSVTQWFAARQEPRAWRVAIRTGEAGPPPAESLYPGRPSQ